ncbi:hypothetical protein [Zavarzinella formosa]|uniref:hypothetical protein n=1 Tax=Zavarzinella formosa TaxID=360055 RepID=UPI0002F15105|nr:hypothetical protein [Zavarzinella formosa]
MAVELRTTHDGLELNVAPEIWTEFARRSPGRMAAWLLRVAAKADRRRYRKMKRGPKKPVVKIKASREDVHRSTFRLLQQRANSPAPPRSP